LRVGGALFEKKKFNAGSPPGKKLLLIKRLVLKFLKQNITSVLFIF
jgi:hypothetical protein